MIAKKIIYEYQNRELPIPIHPDFPVEILYQHFSDTTYDYIDWHWHTELQYNLVSRGTINFHIGNEQVSLTKGEGLFINTKQIHMAVPEEPDSSFLCISFHPVLFEQGGNNYLYQNFFLPVLNSTHVTSSRLTPDACRNMIEIDTYYRQKDFGYELRITSELLALWQHTIKALHITPDKSSDEHNKKENQRLKDILSYIHAHYAESLSLESIANHIHLSRSECSRFFQRTTGQNLFQYITHYRINKATVYLLQTNLSIAQIALETGFSSQSYFTECFKKQKNSTPLSFRRTYKKTGYPSKS